MSLMLLLALATAPIRVAIIDSGLNLQDARFSNVLCAEGHKDLTDTGMVDKVGHGTHIAGIIATMLPKKYCLVIIKAFDPHMAKTTRVPVFVKAIQTAVDSGAKVINISAGGDGYNEVEKKLIVANSDTIFVVAAGNNKSNLKNRPYYPASYNTDNMVVVGSVNDEGVKSSFSNYGTEVDAWELGENVISTIPGGYAPFSGTSQATAIYTSRLLRNL